MLESSATPAKRQLQQTVVGLVGVTVPVGVELPAGGHIPPEGVTTAFTYGVANMPPL